MDAQVLDWLYGVLVSPTETFDEVASKKPTKAALLLILATSVLGTFAQPEQVIISNILPFQIPRGWIIIADSMVSALSTLVVIGAVFCISKMFQPTGDFPGILAAIGFAQFPAFLSLPANLLVYLPGPAGSILGGTASLGVGIWTIVLSVIAIRESRGLTTVRSIISYLIAVFTLLFIALLFLLVIAYAML